MADRAASRQSKRGFVRRACHDHSQKRRVEPDPDNLTASAKLILDALQRVNVIKNDSPQYISLAVEWERAKKRVEQGTVVTIEKWDLDKVQDG